MSDNPISEAIRSTGVPALVDATREFVTKLFGPAAEEGGELLRDYVRSYRWRNQVKILERAREYAANAELDVGAVPLRTLVPLIESAGLEDDPLLQDMWAALLASASGNPHSAAARPAFVQIMKQISPVDAWLLSEYFVVFGFPAPESASVRGLADVLREREPFEPREIRTGITNLIRLGLVSTDLGLERSFHEVERAIEEIVNRIEQSRSRRRLGSLFSRGTFGGSRGSDAELNLSPLGFQFLYAVLPPIGRPISEPWTSDSTYHDLVTWRSFAMTVAPSLDWVPGMADELRASADRTLAELKRRREEHKRQQAREERDST